MRYEELTIEGRNAVMEANKTRSSFKQALLRDVDIPVAPMISLPIEQRVEEEATAPVPTLIPVPVPVFPPATPIVPKVVVADDDVEIIFSEKESDAEFEVAEQTVNEAVEEPIKESVEDVSSEPVEEAIEEPAEKNVEESSGQPAVENSDSLTDVESENHTEESAEEESAEDGQTDAEDLDTSVENPGSDFTGFKKRLWFIRVIKAAVCGVAAGSAVAGVWLILSKLAVIGAEPITSLYIGLIIAALVGGAVFLISRKSDKAFAEELDEQFDLKARVQTMVAYREEEGVLVSLQRQDTDDALSRIPVESYKFKKFWIYITALVLSVAILFTGVFVKNMRDYVPEEEIEPFVLTDAQRKGIGEIIRDLKPMEEEFREPIIEELESLLAKLETITTMPDASAALTESMAVICSITYESSTATEMLNALWDSNDIYFRYLAKALDTSSLSEPDWGDFAEKMVEYKSILMGDNNEGDEALRGVASLKWALDNMNRKLDMTLQSSGLDSSDEIYAAIEELFNANPGGLNVILAAIDGYDDDEAREALDLCFNLKGRLIYDAIALNRVNAAAGERAMTRLAGLFPILLPEFERPEFVKNGESVDGSQGSASDKEDENGKNDGGIGEGATYGSDDLVLDPLTGKYVKYVELIDKYYALMNEKLNSGSYTEEQQEAIRKYFNLLYSGLEKEEGK